MKQKYIIIGLTITLIFVLVAFLILNRGKSTKPEDSVPPSPISSIVSPTRARSSEPTGIILPTEQLSPGELDVIAVYPKDQSENVPSSEAVTITFSRPIISAEVKIYMDPPAERTQTISGNILTLRPKTTWDPGTFYSYNVSFPKDLNRRRTYAFRVAGAPKPISENTADIEVFEEIIDTHRQERPDLFLMNQSPFETEDFSIEGMFESKNPAHYAFNVTLRKLDKEVSKNNFINWLRSLELSDEQIANLDITYQ